jgi:hypothetical protein
VKKKREKSEENTQKQNPLYLCIWIGGNPWVDRKNQENNRILMRTPKKRERKKNKKRKKTENENRWVCKRKKRE